MYQITIVFVDQVGLETITVTHQTTGEYDITQYDNELLWVNESLPGDDVPEWRFGIRAESVVSITIEPVADA